MTWEDFGGNVQPEARRLAYMLNTGDPNAEHQAAMQLSQDLYGLPSQAQVDLVRSTQMYEAPGLGGQLVVEPLLQRADNGTVYDNGNRDVRVVDQANAINDDVATMYGNNRGYRQPGFQLDVFAGINGCGFASMPWMNAGWRDRELHERQNWFGRHEQWDRYDGRTYRQPGFVRPIIGGVGVGVDIGGVHVGVGLPIVGGGWNERPPVFDPRRFVHRRDEHERHDHH